MKKLITTGCSFSDVESGFGTWPVHLAKHLNYELVSKGMCNRGNGIISRSIIYEVYNQLLTTPAEDILVGVQWSGYDRHEVYVNNLKQKQYENVNAWVENPTGFIPNKKNWELLTHYWDTEKSKLYYSKFHTSLGSLILTLEHILRTQWFLEKHNIDYFMTSMRVIPFNQFEKETEYLVKQIDKTKFLPISQGMAVWAKNSGIPMHKDGGHLSEKQNEVFVQEVVLPYISALSSAG